MLLTYILSLFIPVLVTGLLFSFLKLNQRLLRLLLAFSAAYLFALSLMHLLPDIYKTSNSHDIGLYIIIGFFMQIVIEYFSTGIEHGHVHAHTSSCKKHLPYGIFIGLYLHSFLEGLPIFQSVQESHEHGLFNLQQSMIFGISLHNIPISIAFVSLLKDHGMKRAKLILFLIVFASMAPLGCLVSASLHHLGINGFDKYIQYTFAIVIGIFLHISTAIMFETSENHRYNITKLSSIVLGILVAYFLS